MHIVSAILRQRLLQHTPVAAPGVGTLHITHHTARMLPGQRLAPPVRSVELRPEETGALPLTEIITAEMGLDFASAAELCGQWVTWAMSNGDGSMVLEGVGTIWLDTAEFFADPEFSGLLNPLPTDPLTLPAATAPVQESVSGPALQPKGRNPNNYTFSFLALLIVLAALGYLCYYLWTRTGLFSGV